MNLKSVALFVLVIIALSALASPAVTPSAPSTAELGIANAALPTDIPLPANTATAMPTATATETATPTATATRTLTATPRPSPNLTATASLSRTLVLTETVNPNLRVIRVPILMYHYVSVPPADADKYRLDLSVTPDAFEAQMEHLAANGYHPVRLVDLALYLLQGTPLPEKAIVLTFDDGYSDNYTNAFPVLRKHNFAATFFVITQFVEETRWGYVNWTQLEEMAKSGMEIGSHSLDHPELRGRSRAFQNNELAGSKSMIEARLASPVFSFAYPSGKYDSNTINTLKSAGYLSAVTEIQGARQSSDAVYELRRIRIRGSYSVADFDHWIKWFTENGK